MGGDIHSFVPPNTAKHLVENSRTETGPRRGPVAGYPCIVRPPRR